MVLSTAALLLQGLGAAVASPPLPPQDARLLRGARGAQVRFESVRRMHLPRDRWGGGGGGGSGGRCDAYIGRFCYWYDSTESRVVPEPARIGEARAKLLSTLDSAAVVDPTDKWLAGQRVRYLIEASRLDDAVAAARNCRAEHSWCLSLEGLALQVAQRYAAADSVFSVALHEMSDAERCEWLDLTRLAPDGIARELSRASCAERARLDDRLWILGQPLWSTPGEGRDLRSEHFARLTMAAVLAQSANGHGTTWGSDFRELLLRYGWDEWYTRHDPDIGASAWPSITGHTREPSYALFPETPSLTSRVSASSWRLAQPLARSRYSPRHLNHLAALSHQMVRFPRGDSMLIRAAYAIRDTAMQRDSLSAAIGIYRDDTVQVRRADDENVSMMAANDTVVVSVEVVDPRNHRAERARYTIDPLTCDSGWCLSDLLLFDPTRGYAGSNVDSAFAVALTDMRVYAARPLGVFWETQTRVAAPVWLALTVEPMNAGVVRRIATRLHLSREQVPVRLRWQASVEAPKQTQSLTVRLPNGARGKYRVTLTAQPPSGPPISAMREIEILP